MPRGDGTGPVGMGPMTGRGAGYCAGYAMPGYANPVGGRGFFGWGRGGRGFGAGPGGGRGWRNRFRATGLTGRQRAGFAPPMAPPVGLEPYAAPTPRQELDALKGQAEYLEQALGSIRARMEELEKQAAES